MCWLQIPLLLSDAVDKVVGAEIGQPATLALQKSIWHRVLNSTAVKDNLTNPKIIPWTVVLLEASFTLNVLLFLHQVELSEKNNFT